MKYSDMKEDKNYLKKRTMRMILGIVVLSLVLVASITSFYGFNSNMYRLVSNENLKTVEELSQYVTRVLEIKVEECFSVLEASERFIDEHQEGFDETVLERLDQVKNDFGFSAIGVVDLYGNARTTTAQTANIEDKEFFQNVLKGERYVSDVFDGEEMHESQILVAVPLHINGEIQGAIYGRYPVSQMIQELYFENTSSRYFQIIDGQGEYISLSNNEHALATGDSFWGEMGLYTYEDGVTVDSIREQVEKGGSGSFYFEYGKEGRYVSYEPLGINNWYVFSVVTQEEVSNFVSDVNQISFKLLIQMTLCICVIFWLAFYYIKRIYQIVREKNEALEINNRMFHLALKRTNDILFEVDLNRKEVIFHSGMFEGGYKKYRLDQISPQVLLQTERIQQECYEQYSEFYKSLLLQKEHAPVIAQLRLFAGYNWFKILLLDLGKKKEFPHIVGMLENYDDQKMKDMEIERRRKEAINLSKKSKRDFLTNLYNREALQRGINEYLQNSTDFTGIQAFLILDLDHFNEVKDTMGHGTGDQVLKDVAEILRHQFRKEDMIGRLGGDEFVVLLKNVDTEESVCQLASQLNQALEKTYAQGGYSVTISASIGIALAYEDGITFEELYEKADLALYEVKRGQRNGYKIYTQALEDTEDTAKGETAKV